MANRTRTETKTHGRGVAGDDGAASLLTLFAEDGERKYLTAIERRRFYRSRKILRSAYERSFVEMLFWTGCRISEALQLTVMRVNRDDGFVVLRTLKQHGQHKGRRYRIVHVPRFFMRALDRVHRLRLTQRDPQADQLRLLWRFGRQKAWSLVKRVMERARIFGIRATPKGLRHTYGVHAVRCGVPLVSLQKWLGHQSLKTTSIYLRIIGDDDRDYAMRMWPIWARV